MATTINEEERAKFAAMGDGWWAESGAGAPLRALNHARAAFIAAAAGDRVSGGSVLDVGCGGGVLAEALSRLGFGSVTGIDVSDENIAVASAHAAQGMPVGAGLVVPEYRMVAAEELAREEPKQEYDVVVASEVVEHVDNIPLFLDSLASLTAPDGVLVLSTLNKTALSYAVAIVGAEKIARVLPEGTHDWQRFLTPEELTQALDAAGMDVQLLSGMVPDISTRSFKLSRDHTYVNYILAATARPDERSEAGRVRDL